MALEMLLMGSQIVWLSRNYVLGTFAAWMAAGCGGVAGVHLKPCKLGQNYIYICIYTYIHTCVRLCTCLFVHLFVY